MSVPIHNQFTASQRHISTSSSAYSAVLITLIACVTGVGLIQILARTGLSIPLTIPGLALAVFLLVIAWRNWETGIQALMVLIIVEGAIRKWFMPSYAELVYFYKDGLMVATLLGFSMDRRETPIFIQRQLKLLLLLLGPLVIYAFASSANPSAPHPLVSLFGIKAYCLYMPLAFMVPRMFSTKEKLVRFLRWYLIIALAVAALGLSQFTDNRQESSINRYAWSDDAAQGATPDIAVFLNSEGTAFVRITSTFSFISGLAVYIPVVFALLLGLTSLRSTRMLPRKLRWLYYATMGATVMTGFMSGSRGVIVNLVIVVAVFLMFTSLKSLVPRVRQFAIAAVLISVALIFIAPQAVGALYERALGGDAQTMDSQARLAEIFYLPFEEAEFAGAVGYGIGVTQNGVATLKRSLGLSSTDDRLPMDVESESGRVMMELGLVGFVLFIVMRFGILAMLMQACVSIRDPECKALAGVAFAALVFPLVMGGAVVNHTQNVYQWFLIGMVFALLNIDKMGHTTRQSEPATMVGQPRALRTFPLPSPAFDRK